MRLERGWTSGDETAVEVRAGAAAAPGLGRRAVLAGGAGLALFGAGNDVGAAPPELLPDRLPGRVELGGGRPYRLEGGRDHRLSDVTFEVNAGHAGNGIKLDIGEGAQIDVLRIRVLPGVRQLDRFVRIGRGVRIGVLDVEAAEQTALNDDKLDGFVQIRADDVRIEAMRFVRIERCVMIRAAAGVSIGSFDCSSYSRGMSILASRDVHVGRLRARGRSPHARPEPGFNGLLIADSRGLSLPDVVVEDAAEHSVYLAGGGGAEHSEDIRFGQVVSRRAGQCGFKCKSPKMASRRVSIDRLEVINSAYRSRPGTNEDALRVENCHGFRIGELEARADLTEESCYNGLYLDGVRDFVLEAGRVERAFGAMVTIADARGFDNAGIAIAGLDGDTLRSHGYLIRYAKGRMLSGLDVAGGLLQRVGGDVVRIEGDILKGRDRNRVHVAARGVRGAALQGPGNGSGRRPRSESGTQYGPGGIEVRVTAG